MKPQEFYIGVAENGSLVAFHGLTQTKGLSKLIKVREVSPELDAAIEKMVQVLEISCMTKDSLCKFQGPCRFCKALTAYRKAME